MATRLVQRESSASYQDIETAYEETDGGVVYDDVSLVYNFAKMLVCVRSL